MNCKMLVSFGVLVACLACSSADVAGGDKAAPKDAAGGSSTTVPATTAAGGGTSGAGTDVSATIYVPLNGTRVVDGKVCASGDEAVASCKSGTVVGSKLGTTSLTIDGKVIPVVVFDPANPPPEAVAQAASAVSAGGGKSLYVPLNGKQAVAGGDCKSLDDAVAKCASGSVSGVKLGTSSIVVAGQTIPVVVYDPASPPPELAAQQAAAANATGAPAVPSAFAGGVNPDDVATVYQTETSFFGARYSDVWYHDTYTPEKTDDAGNPVAVTSHDQQGKEIAYYYDNSAVFLWKKDHAPCPQPVRFAACSDVLNGQHHFLTANILGTTGNNSWCVSGSSIALSFMAQGVTPVEQPGILGDLCNLKPDGSCPEHMRPLYWSINKKSVASGTTILTSDLVHLLANGELVLSETYPAGCGPYGN